MMRHLLRVLLSLGCLGELLDLLFAGARFFECFLDVRRDRSRAVGLALAETPAALSCSSSDWRFWASFSSCSFIAFKLLGGLLLILFAHRAIIDCLGHFFELLLGFAKVAPRHRPSHLRGWRPAGGC